MTDIYLDTLIADVLQSFDAFYAADTPYHRRLVVRLFASAVEGETYHLKQHCLSRLTSSPTFYSPEEVAILTERQFQLESDSSISSRPQFLKSPENFHFALKAFAKDTLPTLDIRTEAAAWANFKNAFRIRNRVTHPRSESDLEISDTDFACVQHAFFWYRKVLMFVGVQSGLALHDAYDRLREELKAFGHDPGPSEGPQIIPRAELQRMEARLKSSQVGDPRKPTKE